jgi:nicotinamide riboside kinase
MLKNTYKKGVGIVHGSSNTGRSLYVEPMELVEPTNEMKSIFAQLKAEEKCIEDLMSLNNSPAILITDTTILNVKVWCEHVFGTAPAIVKQTCDTRKYDLYFLMKDDIPWEEDPLRNFPNQRPYFFKVFQNELESRKENYVIIEGDFDNRIALAKKYLNNYIATLPL